MNKPNEMNNSLSREFGPLLLQDDKERSGDSPCEIVDRFISQIKSTLAQELPDLVKKSCINFIGEYAKSEERSDSFSLTSDRFFEELSRTILEVIAGTFKNLS